MLKGVVLSLCLALVPVWTEHEEQDCGPVVYLEHGGGLGGEYVEVKGTDNVVEQYLGIPYAQPPTGPLRLAAPEPVGGWEGIRHATQLPAMCIQDLDSLIAFEKGMPFDYPSPGMSEDCLYLNVYTPYQRSESEKLPVMVWIHSGACRSVGGSFMYDGSALAAYENVIVVVIQYRLGILGFFSTGDEYAKGNFGFLDQIASLQWVQQNIESFGGDPQSVTIVSGGVSASLLTLSPMAKGLFHQAIFQSGVATSMDYSIKARALADATECCFKSSKRLVTCLKGLSEAQIINATKKLNFLGATIDGEFLKATAEEVLKSEEFQKVPVLLGVNNDEFGWMLPEAFVPNGWEKGMDRQSVKAMINVFNKPASSGANDILINEYLKYAKTPEDIRDGFTEIVGDVLVSNVLEVADYHRDAGVPVYLYEFQYETGLFEGLRPSFVKADHADEVGFVFGFCFFNGFIKVLVTPSEEDNQMCRTVMAYWANFMRSGSPNGPGLVNWPAYDESKNYLNLGLNQSEGQNLKKEKMHFLNVELPQKVAELQEASIH